MDMEIFKERLDPRREGMRSRGRRPPMAAICGIDLRGEVAIHGIEIFVSVVVERRIIDIGNREGFEKGFDPAGAMEIVVFNDIDQGVRG